MMSETDISGSSSLHSSNGESKENSKGRMAISPFEIEEEIISLVEETSDRAPNLRKRSNATGREDQENGHTLSRVLGIFRGDSAFSYVLRNACLLGLLGWLVFLYLGTMEYEIEDLNLDDPRGEHQSSFGGDKNTAYSNYTPSIPVSNVGQKVDSISEENTFNLNGNYWHDPYKSPFASVRYQITADQRQVEQTDFEMMRNQTKRIFGSWDLVDPYYQKHNHTFRTAASFGHCHMGDCNSTIAFPQSSWQKDPDYVQYFIKQAKQHVHRVREGIYQEYGHGTINDDLTNKTQQQLNARDDIFRVIRDNFQLDDQNIPLDPKTKQQLKGIAYLNQNAWDALLRKIMHCVITASPFFVVVVGDAAAAGHGNNFIMSPAMQFHYLMEPILDFLRVQLITRNMAMKEPASIVAGAIAGADIFGEADILWYHSSSENKVSDEVQDLLFKQAILSGERVPLILAENPGSIMHDSNNEAWVGSLLKNDEICGSKTDGVCDKSLHDGVCWIERYDVSPPTTQLENMPDENKYPNRRTHQLEARKLSLLFLDAIDAAFDKWKVGIQTDGSPLADKYWHIGDAYNRVREAVRTFQKPNYQSPCEKMMKELSMVCHLEMHGNTEWTPRVKPYMNSLVSLLNDMQVVDREHNIVYDSIDLLPLQWKVPPDQVDPHLIAISTSVPPRPSQYKSMDNFETKSAGGTDSDTTTSIDSTDTEKAKKESKGNDRQRKKARNRQLRTKKKDKIVTGKGWMLYNPILGFCDGSAQSTCGRDESSDCLMAGHNDNTGGILGDDLSGWLWLRVPAVKEGLIFARFETNLEASTDQITEGWKEVNGNHEKRRRMNLPDDFVFEYAINDEIKKSFSKDEFLEWGISVADGMELYPLLVDKDMEKQKHADTEFDVTIRIHSNQTRAATLLLTHLYYA